MSVLFDQWLDFAVHHYVCVGLSLIVLAVLLNVALLRGPDLIVSMRHLRH
nr:hypothetical protein [uncultured Lichenicoccus sp.]